MRDIFLEISNTKCSGEIIHIPFSKISKLDILWINSLKFYAACLYNFSSSGISEYIESEL